MFRASATRVSRHISPSCIVLLPRHHIPATRQCLANPSFTSSISKHPVSRSFTQSHFRRADSAVLAKAIREIQDKFVEAKDEYEMALESQGTTYAVEDNETAREMAGELSQLYDGIMNGQELNEAEKQTIKEKLSARIRELASKRVHEAWSVGYEAYKIRWSGEQFA